MFGCQTSKNVHDVQKVVLEVLVCLSFFRRVLRVRFDEIDVKGSLHIHDYFMFGNVRIKLLKGKQKFP